MSVHAANQFVDPPISQPGSRKLYNSRSALLEPGAHQITTAHVG